MPICKILKHRLQKYNSGPNSLYLFGANRIGFSDCLCLPKRHGIFLIVLLWSIILVLMLISNPSLDTQNKSTQQPASGCKFYHISGISAKAFHCIVSSTAGLQLSTFSGFLSFLFSSCPSQLAILDR